MLESSCFPVGKVQSSVGDLRMVPLKNHEDVGLPCFWRQADWCAPLAMEILERPSKSMGFPKTKSLQSKVHHLKLHRLAVA